LKCAEQEGTAHKELRRGPTEDVYCTLTVLVASLKGEAEREREL
jgi:hypothetical protein